MTSRTARPLVALVALAPLAQADLTVGQPGDGADFTDIGAALAAAAVGENVFVLPGTYDAGFSIAAGVNLIGAGSDQSILVAPGTARHFDVSGLPAGQAVRVVGFGLGGEAAFGAGVALTDNAGSVTLAELAYAPSSSATGLQSTGVDELIDVAGSGQVILDKVAFDASELTDTTTQGAWALNAQDSRLFVTDCEFTGGGSNGLNGRDGVRLVDAELWLTATDIRGADGSIVVGDDPLADAPAGGAGILAIVNARVEFFGGLSQSIRGGDGGGVVTSGGTPLIAGSGGVGVILAGGSTAVLAGGLLEGGSSPVGGTSPPFSTDPSSTFFFAFEPSLSLVTDTALVQPGDTVTVEVGGLGGSAVGIFFGLDLITPVPLPPFAGLAQIQALPPAPLAVLQINPFGGTASLPLPIPSALPPGFRVYLQAADLGVSIAPSISMPTLIQVGL